MTRQAAPALIIKDVGGGQLISCRLRIWRPNNSETDLQFESHSLEEIETRHLFTHERVKIVVCYVTVLQIEPVLFGAVRHHGVRALETERPGRVFGSQREFLYDDVILEPFQKFEIYENIHSVDIVFQNDETTINYVTGAALTAVASAHRSPPELKREGPIDLPVCCRAVGIEKPDKLIRVYPLPVWRANRQQYLRLTLLVRTCSCLLL